MNLQEEIQALRKEVAQFKEALHLLENPPARYGPKPGEIPILDYLKVELSAAREDKERQKLLEISRQTLADAEQRLASKEEELSHLQSDCEAIVSQMEAAGRAVLAAESRYREAIEEFRALADQHQRRWQELNPRQELYRQLGRIDFPGFAQSGACGTLTSAAIAKDLHRS